MYLELMKRGERRKSWMRRLEQKKRRSLEETVEDLKRLKEERGNAVSREEKEGKET